MRTWLALGLVGFWSLGALVAACGGDDSASSSSGSLPDSGASSSGTSGSPSGEAGPSSITVVASDLTVYVGANAALDASQTSGATSFSWAVKTAPTGSTATVGNGTTAKPTFVPDVSGDYVLTVTATSAGASGTKDVKVKAVAAPLFFMQSNGTEDPPYFEYRSIGTDKSNNHPIACRINGDKLDAGGNAQQFLQVAAFLADIGLDSWEGPPGSPSRAALSNFLISNSSGASSSLQLATTDSNCTTSPPVQITHVIEDGGPGTSELIQPRFSPSGARVAFVEQRQPGYVIETIGNDGNDRRIVARFCEDGQDSCWSPAVFPSRPQWLDGTTVGWARGRQQDGGNGWEVTVASDTANPQPHVYMTCDGGVPRSIASLKDGSVLANRTAPDTQIEDLIVFKPMSQGGPCQIVRNLTLLSEPSSYARDFAVSPDGTEVVFVRSNAPPPDSGARFGGDLYTVPLDGSSAPKPFSGTAQYALFGGRYVASGALIAWNGLSPYADGGAATSLDGGSPAIRVAPRAGTQISEAVASNIDAGIYVIGGGNGGSCDFNLKLCSAASGPASSGAAPLAAAGALIALAFRRKRRRSR